MKTKKNEQNGVWDGTTVPSVEEQERYFGIRVGTQTSNSILLYERFPYKEGEKEEETGCLLLVNRDDGKKVGSLTRLPLTKVWDLVEHYTKGRAEAEYGISRSEWHEASGIIDNYVRTFMGSIPPVVGDVLRIPELDFEQLFLHKADRVIALLDAAIRLDIEESARLKKKWKSIPKYPFKVALETSQGGIFTSGDAEILRKNKVKTLNRVRKNNVYSLKNLFLEHPFAEMIREIKLAYREDFHRRKDRWYQILPFLFGFLSFAGAMVLAYIYQYTLIKNTPMTVILMAILTLWALNLGMIVWAGFRAKWRRRTKRPEYIYFTKKVKNRIKVFALCGVFMLASVTLFYQRYDGYNQDVYYRDMKDGTIAVAGLFNEEIKTLNIPDTIDGKTVSEIDLYAFQHDDFEYVTLPETLRTIDRKAFLKAESLLEINIPASVTVIEKGTFEDCSHLATLNAPGVTEIKEKGFEACESLTWITLPSLASIGDSAFRGCIALPDALFIPAGLQSLGNRAFEGCEAMTKVDLSGCGGLTAIGERAFSNCFSLTELRFSPVLTAIPSRTAENCRALSKVDIDECVTSVGKRAFFGCNTLSEIIIPDSVTFMGQLAFGECYGLVNFNTPFLGENAETGKNGLKYLFGNAVSLQNLTLRKVTQIEKNAFVGGSSLQSVTLGDQVVSIGDGAFKGLGMLQTFTFPQSLTHIGNNAFRDCVALSELKLPPALLTIGKSAFKNCAALTELDLPDSLVTIERAAFEGCNAITTVRAPFVGMSRDNTEYGVAHWFVSAPVLQKVTLTATSVVGTGMFTDAPALTEVELNEGIASIGDSAFEGLIYLKSINIPASVTSIGAKAFEECDGLTAFDFTDCALNSIGDGAFRGCDALATLKLPDSVTAIPAGMVDGCKLLDETNLPAAITSIGAEAYRNCDLLTEISVPTTVTSMGKNAFAGCDRLVSFTGPFIGESATKNKDALKYTFGEGVALTEITLTNMSEIGSGTFAGGSNLTEITMQAAVTKIGKDAFKGLNLLTQIELPEGVTEIGDNAFRDCDGLTEITVPASVTKIGKNAFADCNKLSVYTGPFVGKSSQKSENGLSYLFGLSYQPKIITLTAAVNIGKYAFTSAIDLREVYLNEGVTAIEDGAFENVDSLVYIELPTSLETIGKEAFKDCSKLSELDMSKTRVTTIGESAFEGNIKLTSLSYSTSLTAVPAKMAYGCTALREIVLPATVIAIGEHAFERCEHVVELALPNAITTIGAGAFRRMTALTAVTMPTQLTELGDQAFEECSRLLEADMSKTALKEVGDKVFKNCKVLESAVIPATAEKLGSDIFDNCTKLTELEVPFIGSKQKSAQKIGYLTDSDRLQYVKVTNATKIADKAFANSDMLTRVVLGDTVQEVGDNIFKNCDRLTTVYMPYALSAYEDEIIPYGVDVHYGAEEE